MRSAASAAQVDAFGGRAAPPSATAPHAAADDRAAHLYRRRPAILTSPHLHSDLVRVTAIGVLEEDARIEDRPGKPSVLHLHLACRRGLHYVARLELAPEAYAQNVRDMDHLRRGYLTGVLAEGLQLTHLEDGRPALLLLGPLAHIVAGA